jgi:hypothetical protein
VKALSPATLDQMLASVHQFCAAQPLNDDCTVVELTYVGPTRTFQGVIE